MKRMLKDMSIKIKLICSFSIMVLLVLFLSIYSLNGLNNTSDGFDTYREAARDSRLVGNVKSMMLETRMNVKDFLITKSTKDLDGMTPKI